MTSSLCSRLRARSPWSFPEATGSPGPRSAHSLDRDARPAGEARSGPSTARPSATARALWRPRPAPARVDGERACSSYGAEARLGPRGTFRGSPPLRRSGGIAGERTSSPLGETPRSRRPLTVGGRPRRSGDHRVGGPSGPEARPPRSDQSSRPFRRPPGPVCMASMDMALHIARRAPMVWAGGPRPSRWAA